MSPSATNAENQTYEQLDALFRNQYTYQAPASALMWWTPWNAQLERQDGIMHFGLRVECRSLGIEFSNFVSLGNDPEGTLYYDNPLDFSDYPKSDSKAGFYVAGDNDGSAKGIPVALYVDFSDGSDSTNMPFAKFLAKDPGTTKNGLIRNDSNSIVNAAALRGNGTWSPRNICEAYANMDQKSTANPLLTVTIGSIRKTVSFEAPWASDHHRLDTKGTLMFKDIATIDKGIYAHYGEASVVFTDKPYQSTDFYALFYPLKETANVLGAWKKDGIAAKWSTNN